MLGSRSNDQYRRLESYMPDEEEEIPPAHSFVHFADVDKRSSRSWNHVENLDDFFHRVYIYHQKNGFVCILAMEMFSLLQFVFIVCLSTLLIQCIDYPLLFHERLLSNTTRQVKLEDVFYPVDECMASTSTMMQVLLSLSLVFLLTRIVHAAINVLKFWEIHMFYIHALDIRGQLLSDLTWCDVLTKLRQVQSEHQMCIHKRDLTPLDVYSRILRFKNYEVAMLNKDVLPVKLYCCGSEFVFFSRALKLNLEFLLFWGPWAPFSNNWSLKEVYKRKAAREALAAELRHKFVLMGVLNLIFAPVILLYQILFSFFSYADLLKREPGSLGVRRWSLYARLYLRHYNELEHELTARLNRAYRPAQMYLNCFVSSLGAIVAENVMFLSGSICAVILVLTVIDEDTLETQHVLTILTLSGLLTAVCRGFLPEDNLIYCPELLLRAVLAHTHYMPAAWRDHAHTQAVRREFDQLFQLKAVHLLEELLSPIITPFVLIFLAPSKALEMIDFVRNFSVDVVGVGDVCSIALFDVSRHGNPDWRPPSAATDPTEATGEAGEKETRFTNLPSQAAQSEEGKVELSLLNFALTNPEWRPPAECSALLHSVRHSLPQACTVYDSLLASVSAGGSVLGQPSSLPPLLASAGPIVRGAAGGVRVTGRGVRRKAGPLSSSVISAAAHAPIAEEDEGHETLSGRVGVLRDLVADEMSSSVLAMHDNFHLRKEQSVHHLSSTAYNQVTCHEDAAQTEAAAALPPLHPVLPALPPAAFRPQPMHSDEEEEAADSRQALLPGGATASSGGSYKTTPR